MNIEQALALRGEIASYERQENVWLLEHILQLDALQMRYRGEQKLTTKQETQYIEALARLATGEPLAYIIGSQPFWNLDLKVTSDTLVPRPDTEILVETCLQLPLPQQVNMIDLGTGTGAIALSLATERPNWQITATDIYQPTLQVAQENAQRYHLNHVQFKLGAWFEALEMPVQPLFDLIVSNPPYIDEQDQHVQALQAEPQRALVAKNQGLADLQIIIEQGQFWLKSNGWMVLEHGYDQAQAVQDIFAQAHFQHIRTVQDYGGNDRVTLAQKMLSF